MTDLGMNSDTLSGTDPLDRVFDVLAELGRSILNPFDEPDDIEDYRKDLDT